MLYVISAFSSLLNNFYCDIHHLYNIVILIILNSVTSANLKKAGAASRKIVIKNNTLYTRCYDHLCSSFWTCSFFVQIRESQQNKRGLCTYVANDVWDSVTRVHFSSLAEHAQSNVNMSQ